MLAGKVPWRPDVLKKPRVKVVTGEEKLLREGWQYVNVERTLEWRDQKWRLMFKVMDERPRSLPGFEPIDVVLVQDAYGNSIRYQYIEFMAVNLEDRHTEMYAYGNFIKGLDKPYTMRGKQFIRVDDETKSNKSYGSIDSYPNI